MRTFMTCLALLWLNTGTIARAEWREARTDHFILTINDSEQAARTFALKLEHFDAALRQLYGVAEDPDQYGRPIVIYALEPDMFHKMFRGGVLGTYDSGLRNSRIFILHDPKLNKDARIGALNSQTLLLHEYSHHFTYANFPIAYPKWFSEGFAEFNANSSFEKDGSIIIGYPANYRGKVLKSGNHLSMKQLLDPDQYGPGYNSDLVYGRSWLLTNDLILNPRRHGQLANYLKAMNRGEPSIAAAEAAFGNLTTLSKELDGYQTSPLEAPLRISPPTVEQKVTVVTLPAGTAAMMAYHVLVANGLNKSAGYGIALEAAKVAAHYPDDPVVQTQWGEVEIAMGRFDKADVAADTALKLEPDLSDALVLKARVAFNRAAGAELTDPKVWAITRSWLLKANKLNPNAVLPLYYYFKSFSAAKAKAPAGAVKGLMRAAVLAPESNEIRMALAQQMLIDGDTKGARAAIQAAAYMPHGERSASLPRRILNLLDAGKIEEAKAAFMTANN